MFRRFREHDSRFVADLRGIWDFAFLGDVEPESVDVRSIHFNDRMSVPGCFDATPGYAGRRGLAAYRTRVFFRDDAPHRLVFDGVHHWCRIFLGGRPYRDHAGGFTRFTVDVTDPTPGMGELVVLVDNRFDYQRCPLHLAYYDWYHYGGIARTVELHRLGKLWIDAVKVVTEDLARRQVGISVDYQAIEATGKTRLNVVCDGRLILSEALSLAQGSGQIYRTLEIPWTRLWSPEQPHLHLLHVRLGEDDVRERIGLRQVTVEEQQILINGKPVRLLGFNRHEAHPQFGHALPEELLVTDLQLLRDMGCNFVRGSHYPQDLRFLDLCDEAGICVWNEAIGWQNNAEQLSDPHFMAALGAHVEEMVAMSQNRPAVIMWGLLNEGLSDDPLCRPGYATLIEQLRRLDPTRPVTYACNRPLTDVCLDLVDIVSINSYPGWYHGDIEDIPRYLDEYVAHLDAVEHTQKPIIISEIGAGAVPGWRDLNQARWSEQYQARLLETVIHHLFVERTRVSGLSIWQFCDCRTAESLDRILGRPRGFNNKGVVDEYRRPKMAYEAVKRQFQSIG